MSTLYGRRYAINKISEDLISSKFWKYKPKLIVVQSEPRSDMGKGTLVAQLLANIGDSIALKFDGLLNTNESGRHTAVGHDDFGIYDKFQSRVKHTRLNYILGGELIRDFILEYGEYENATINPYLSNYFLLDIAKRYEAIGCPSTLIIELGGTIGDDEVITYVPAALVRLSEHFGQKYKHILLTELGYNGEYIKTKSVQDGCRKFKTLGVGLSIIAARLPSELQGVDRYSIVEYERVVKNKLLENLALDIKNVCVIPYYPEDRMVDYTRYIADNMLPMLAFDNIRYDKVVIGSRNKEKITDYTSYLQGVINTANYQQLGLDFDVEEGLFTIEENSLAKARAYSRLTGLPALSEDTGFCIVALNGQPGVSIKRWGGLFKTEMTGSELLSHISDELQGKDDTSCYFRTVYTLYIPDGRTYHADVNTDGYIDLECLHKALNSDINTGYPLGLIFKRPGRDKVWADMTVEEKKTSDHEILLAIRELIEKI
jgi:XTP/dITP diphosphohydrolase